MKCDERFDESSGRVEACTHFGKNAKLHAITAIKARASFILGLWFDGLQGGMTVEMLLMLLLKLDALSCPFIQHCVPEHEQFHIHTMQFHRSGCNAAERYT